MWRFPRFFRRRQKGREIGLDEILLDASNLPDFDRGRLEGKLETPIGRGSILAVGAAFALVALVFAGQLYRLQIVEGAAYAAQSESNRLDRIVIFAERGVIYDRNGEPLAWNAEGDDVQDFAERAYTDRRGLGVLLGYVSYPQKDRAGFYYRTEYIGRGGVEESYDDSLLGRNGEQFIEVTAQGEFISGHVVHRPTPGESVTLSIDAALSEALYDTIERTVAERGFRSGTGAIMDVETGELVAFASWPSFDPEVMARGKDADAIDAYQHDERLPFLNKLIGGLYTPGSIVKPLVALGVLAENVIDPLRKIESTGRLVVPNPYFPDQPSIFTDWRAHGFVDMRGALAASSNVYFYVVGGGFGDIPGLGITKLHDHLTRFGLGSKTGIALTGEVEGIVPNPAWKEARFDGDPWRLGDTYNTAIGQFGFQTTPIALLRAYALLANGGTLVTPTVVRGARGPTAQVGLDPADRQVVIEGMRQAVLDGTARAVNRSDVAFAGKTGTAEVGAAKRYVNSWVGGFYPYESPKYAFVLMMEQGPVENLFGSAPAFSQFLNWVKEHKPEYLTEIP